jgi:hypothetical protein
VSPIEYHPWAAIPFQQLWDIFLRTLSATSVTAKWSSDLPGSWAEIERGTGSP